MASVFNDPVLPLLLLTKAGGLGFGGGVDLPKECFLGEAFSFRLTGGKDVGCLISFFTGIFFESLSELPLSFSRLELAELDSSRDDFLLILAGLLVVSSTEDFLLILVEGCCSLAPGGRVGFFGGPSP